MQMKPPSYANEGEDGEDKKEEEDEDEGPDFNM